MKNKKINIILLVTILLGSISIGVISYFFAKSIIKKDINENEINISNNNLFDIHKNLDKYLLCQNTFDINSYINEGNIKFNKTLIENNLYNIISNEIYKNYNNIDKNLINIKIYYQINYNKLNIIANWKIKCDINSNNLYKEYYDKFSLKVDRK